MTSLSVHDARLPVLSSPNLRKLDASKLDKDHFLRSYIRSQQSHLTSYAREGKSMAASWSAKAVTTSPKKPARDIELESGFGTPMLKPRAIRRQADTRTENIKRKQHAREESGPSLMGEVAKKAASPRPKNKDGRSTSGMKETQRPQASKSSPKTKTSNGGKHKEHAAPLKSPAGGARDTASEDEHRNRLAERRERRRAKKAIVNPKPPPPLSDSSTDNGEGDTHAKKKQKRKGKKGKGVNIPAGLALMHGFSATNVGKNRLTLDPAVGVFNKGKASAKTTVKKAKMTIKPQSKARMFSENFFLNKTKVNSRKAASEGSHSSDSDKTPDVEPEDAPPSPKLPRRKTKTSKDKTDESKRPRSPSFDEPSPDQAEGASQDQVRPAKKRKTERAKSPVWDIELEDGQLAASSRSDQESAPSESGTKVAGTVLMDTRAFGSRWAVPENRPGEANATRTRDSELPAEDDHMSDGVSTIDPSHSASQVAFRGPTFSRFFGQPMEAEEVRGADKSSACRDVQSVSTVHSSSRPEGSCVGPEDTVEDRMVRPTWDVVPSDTCQGEAEHLPSGTSVFPSRSAPSVNARPLSCPPSPALSQGRWSGIHSPVIAPPRLSHHDVHPACASPEPWKTNSSLVGSTRDAVEAANVRQPAGSSPRDWTAEFLGLLAEDGPTHTFLPNASWPTDPLEAIGDDYFLVAGAGLATGETPDVFGGDDMELQAGDTVGVVDDAGFADMEPCEVDYLEEDANQYCESAPGASWDGVDEELYDIPYRRRQRVKFSDEVLCYADDGAVTSEEEPAINDAVRAYGFGEGRFPEFGEPDVRSADPGPAAVGLAADFRVADDVAVDDESNGPEMEEDLEVSDVDQEHSVLGSLQRFSQGRALLMGVASEIGVTEHAGSLRRPGVSAVEEDVVRSLRGHWRPQRF
ncbi:hypothetical protein BD309DRAFT_967431 [Dichomitus squalens]|uniref:Uncharacterized protein n=1 Tax=Dichomitus squalens TaxID=114155 RepID=A0A4Q9PVQ9_9APHY|nr:hypothetical protein BD309DRAFT_967431 [Dichomitus squalens]TBU58717.1 hypothetical protein BD310DRAFT_926388 [Dichomitus squalens]